MWLATNATARRALILIAMIWLGVETAAPRGSRKGRLQSLDRTEYLIWLSVVGTLILPAINLKTPFWIIPAGWWCLTGIFLMATGVGLRAWAILVLGNRFSRCIRPIEASQLVVTGPYRRIRHPAYLGMLLAVGGWALAWQDLPSLLAAALLLIPSLLYRIRVEERVLEQVAGYQEYRSHTYALFPFVY